MTQYRETKDCQSRSQNTPPVDLISTTQLSIVLTYKSNFFPDPNVDHSCMNTSAGAQQAAYSQWKSVPAPDFLHISFYL